MSVFWLLPPIGRSALDCRPCHNRPRILDLPNNLNLYTVIYQTGILLSSMIPYFFKVFSQPAIQDLDYPLSSAPPGPKKKAGQLARPKGKNAVGSSLMADRSVVVHFEG